MGKLIHYKVKFNMPGWKKDEVIRKEMYMEEWKDVLEPVYEADPIIPPGITMLKNCYGRHCYASTKTDKDGKPCSYESWVDYHLNQDPKSTIHTIEVDSVQWSVGDWFHHYPSEDFQIKSFEWIPTYRNIDGWWKIETTNGKNCNLTLNMARLNIFKGKYRKLVRQLPDENGKMVDMYEGDKFYRVWEPTWDIHDFTFGDAITPQSYAMCFATEAAAENYVRNNKPQVPWGPIERLIEAFKPVSVPSAGPIELLYSWNGEKLLKELEKYRP